MCASVDINEITINNVNADYAYLSEGYTFLMESLEVEGGSKPDDPVCEHAYEAVVAAPICTKKGYTTYTCECGHTYKVDEVDALGQDYKDGVCTVCGADDPDNNPNAYPSKNFPDVPSETDSAHADIDYCAEKGLMSGIGGTFFKPKGTLTCTELGTILYRVSCEANASDFTVTAVISANQKGIINSIVTNNITTLAPEACAIREQTASIIMRYLKAV